VADTTGDPSSAGAVAYEYKIGKYEVTNAQYAQFLNAVAATDTNSLYNANMGGTARGGITQSDASPNFTYAVKANMGNKPVNYVNWYDCLRFCNWLHNGRRTGTQSTGTTEDGAYTLTGATSVAAGNDPTHGANGRNVGALFWLPSEDEWYKAAYHEPGASSNSYWLYPTRNDSAPTIATADGAGSIDNDTANIANYFFGADWNGQNGNVTTVGSGGTGGQSFYGAADMGGNVFEWNEQDFPPSGDRGLRGGSWDGSGSALQSSFRGNVNPANESDNSGFRVAGP
jgi:sulfatase modifying factor 1